MSWYRQYRPSTIAGLHAVAVKEQLEKLRQAKNFPHALLLTGPRGAGKTSTARILAAMLNEPTNELGKPLKDANPKDELVQRIAQGTSLVVHELDAASHRGIDDVRALKEQAYIPPQEGKVSVFILDEVHMLTTEAFNALLKLLEEPPQNVVFILATTEEQKVPATIVSRCTVVRFRKATPAEIGTALSDIVKDQKLDIDQEALQAIATAADGSFRDAVKTLETVSAGTKHITLEHVQQLLQTTPTETVFACIDLILAKNEKGIVEFFNQLRQIGRDPKSFWQGLVMILHQDLVAGVSQPDKAKYQKKVSQFLLSHFMLVDMQSASPIPFLPLELKALEIVFKAQEKKTNSAPSSSGDSTGSSPKQQSSTSSAAKSASSARDAVSEPTISVMRLKPTALDVVPNSSDLPTLTATPPIKPEISVMGRISDPQAAASIVEKWGEFILEVEQRNSSLGAVLRSSRAKTNDEGNIQISVFYQFHRDQLKQPKFAQILDEASAAICGQVVVFECQVAVSQPAGDTLSNIKTPNPNDEHLVQLAQEVFL